MCHIIKYAHSDGLGILILFKGRIQTENFLGDKLKMTYFTGKNTINLYLIS